MDKPHFVDRDRAGGRFHADRDNQSAYARRRAVGGADGCRARRPSQTPGTAFFACAFAVGRGLEGENEAGRFALGRQITTDDRFDSIEFFRFARDGLRPLGVGGVRFA